MKPVMAVSSYVYQNKRVFLVWSSCPTVYTIQRPSAGPEAGLLTLMIVCDMGALVVFSCEHGPNPWYWSESAKTKSNISSFHIDTYIIISHSKDDATDYQLHIAFTNKNLSMY
jgi:hypothetical protein